MAVDTISKGLYSFQALNLKSKYILESTLESLIVKTDSCGDCCCLHLSGLKIKEKKHINHKNKLRYTNFCENCYCSALIR